MKIESPAFIYGEFMPIKYTCDGENINPPLLFHDIPEDAKELVLMLREKTRIHWLVRGIPSDTKKIEEGKLPKGSTQVENDFHTNDYIGPCPSFGDKGFYNLELFALDEKIKLPHSANSKQVLKEVESYSTRKAIRKLIYFRKPD